VSVAVAPVAPDTGLPRSQLIWFARYLRAFIRRELMATSAYRTSLVMRAFSFVLAVVSLVFFSRFIGSAANPHLEKYGGSYLAFSVIGFLAAELQQVGLSGLATRIRMAQVMGVLESELSTPAPPWMVLGAPPIYEFGTAALRSVAYLMAASLLLGVRFHRANLASVAVTIPLVLAAFAGLGLLTAASTMLARKSNPVAVVMGALSFFLSGVIYPVSVLPGWLQTVAALLPLTRAGGAAGGPADGGQRGGAPFIAAGAGGVCGHLDPDRSRGFRLFAQACPYRRLAHPLLGSTSVLQSEPAIPGAQRRLFARRRPAL
jgi:ABC-2 type transport system permease protein